MIYYKSKYLSDKLDINLAKWKRWSRAFLAPDPLGGLQSGVARQFNLKEAFKVYLGGYLVGQMKFTIPDAARILDDLGPWLKETGFYQLTPNLLLIPKEHRHQHHIYIHSMPSDGNGFIYAIRSILSVDSKESGENIQERFEQTTIGPDGPTVFNGGCASAHLISISTLYRHFLHQLK